VDTPASEFPHHYVMYVGFGNPMLMLREDFHDLDKMDFYHTGLLLPGALKTEE
jgi:hypothetical protein